MELDEILGVPEIRRFDHRSQSSQRELFLLLGQALKDEIVKKVKNANSYGLMVDEATDVSVVEQLISFVQFADPETGVPEECGTCCGVSLKTPQQGQQLTCKFPLRWRNLKACLKIAKKNSQQRYRKPAEQDSYLWISL